MDGDQDWRAGVAPSRDEREARDLFAERYGRPSSDATQDLERLVIGSGCCFTRLQVRLEVRVELPKVVPEPQVSPSSLGLQAGREATGQFRHGTQMTDEFMPHALRVPRVRVGRFRFDTGEAVLHVANRSTRV